MSRKTEQEITPEYMNFTSGVYEGIHYKWEIGKKDGNRLYIKNFRPVCDCGAELTLKTKIGYEYYNQPKLYCVNCKKMIKSDYNDEIKRDAQLYFSNLIGKKIQSYNKSS